jgi:Protein of unknown function (DUF4236)
LRSARSLEDGFRNLRRSPPAYDPDMALRFYRRFRLFPGFTLNLSKRGVSISAGVRGAHVTIGTRGTRETVGIPGTGIGYTAFQPRHRRRASGHVPPPIEPAMNSSPVSSVTVPPPMASAPVHTGPIAPAAVRLSARWIVKALAVLALAAIVGLAVGIAVGG